MTRDYLEYNELVEAALRGVVREALAKVAERGLRGSHHFYIGFKTRYPGVEMPAHLLAKYPEEITIVLQHQFWGLEVADDSFAVTLSFSGVNERLVVPLYAITSFADPGVQFALQFTPSEEAAPAESRPESAPPAPERDDAGAAEDGPQAGAVVSLDNFRQRK